MIRTIKFRGKRLDNGEWVYGSLLQGENQCVIATVKGDSVNVHECFEVDPVTVGQFTGLLDKDGKEIYEGDIFGIPCKDVKNHFYRMVEYCCDGFYLVDNCKDVKYGDLLHREISLDGNYSGMAKELRYSGSDYCVVGNIHDNPELLNEK